MTIKFLKISPFLFLLLVGAITISCDQLKQVDRVLKKSFGQINRFERQKNNYSKRLGLDEKKEKESNSGQVDNSSNYNTIEQKNIINEYGYLFEIINGIDPGVMVNNGEISDPGKVYSVLDSVKFIDKNVEVFGWHPYWMKSSWNNYPFNLLSTISYFSYNINPDNGDPINILDLKDWSDSNFVRTAQDNNTRVLLTVSLHGQKKIINFLNNKSIWERLFANVSELILSKNADGVDINFENLPASQTSNFQKFILEFKRYLDEEFYKNNRSKPSFLSMTIPASKQMQNYSINSLTELVVPETNREVVNLFIIMGYDFHQANAPSPTSPLSSSDNSPSLNQTVQIFNALSSAKNKSILALPYYGIMYNIEPIIDTITDSQIGLRSYFDKKLTYREISDLFIDNPDLKYQIDLDPVSMTKQLSVVFDDNTMKEIFYDDSFTLSKKYSFVMNNEFRGVGLWALGYDNQRSELWEVIENYFTTNEKIFNDPIAEVNGHVISFSKKLVKDKNIYFVIVLFLTMSVIISGLILMFDANFREKVSSSRMGSFFLLTVLYIFLIPLIVVINEAMRPIGIFVDSNFNLYISMFLGAFLFYLGSKINIKKEDKP